MTSFEHVKRYLVESYATLDERSLGLGRIVLAATLLTDLAKRVPSLHAWYTNEGLLPNHTMLWSPPYEHTFSLFFMASHGYEVAAGFVLCALAYLSLLVGYRTKLAQLASFVAVISLHGRVMFIQIGGDVALSELVFWTLFLPLGRRFSVDSLLEELRHVVRGEPRPARPNGVAAFACFALLLQLAAVYLFNAWQKNGPMWLDGSLLHYVLELDPIITRYGLALRSELTPSMSAFLTHAARLGEALVPILLLFPVARPIARSLAIATLVGLHLGFAALMNVGLFSLAMIAYTPFFVPGAVWAFFEKRRAARRKKATPGRSRAALFAEACPPHRPRTVGAQRGPAEGSPSGKRCSKSRACRVERGFSSGSRGRPRVAPNGWKPQRASPDPSKGGQLRRLRRRGFDAPPSPSRST